MCYSFNTEKKGHEVETSSQALPQKGLILTLNTQPEEYYGPFSADGTGFRINVHEQNEPPQIQQSGVDISPGFRTEISFRKIIVSATLMLVLLHVKALFTLCNFSKACLAIVRRHLKSNLEFCYRPPLGGLGTAPNVY